MNVGCRLRNAREARGLSLEDLSRTTRIKSRALEAIEKNEAEVLPPRPYGRGFVSTYAAHVGLNPQETVRDYFLQFAPPPPPADAGQPVAARTFGSHTLLTVPRTRILYVAVGVLVLALLARGLLSRDAEPAPARVAAAPDTGAVGTGGSTQAPAPAPKPTTTMTVQLEATGPVWVTASADGRQTIFRTLQPGQRETLRGNREIAIRVGDAGAIRWQINDRPAAVMGARGAVRSARVTPDTLADEP